MRTVFMLALLAATSFTSGVEKWRADYEAGLKAPGGWLSVAGLFWLHEGGNLVGSDPQSEIVLPAGTPARAGVPAGSTISDCGSDPTRLPPSCSQKRPATESQPPGAFSPAS